MHETVRKPRYTHMKTCVKLSVRMKYVFGDFKLSAEVVKMKFPENSPIMCKPRLSPIIQATIPLLSYPQ